MESGEKTTTLTVATIRGTCAPIIFDVRWFYSCSVSIAMTADLRELHASVQSEKVFEISDYLLFTLLTVVSYSAIAYFITHWFAYGDWFARPVAFWGLTLTVFGRLAINQFRWWYLPFMRKPVPMIPRPGWKVGVATTFVPGAESIEMLEETLRALVALNYPHDTWVLDEGNDIRVISLCTELGAFHFSRKESPHYQTDDGTFRARSKHGNYNAWLHEVGFERYEIIAAFDPDHVPEPAFLSEVLGYFNDPQVGYVQAAQAYYNQQASFIARGAAEETYGYYSSTQMFAFAMGYPVVTGCHNTHRVAALGKRMANSEKAPVIVEEVLVTSVAQTDALANLLMERASLRMRSSKHQTGLRREAR